MNMLSVSSCIRFRRVTSMGMLALMGVLFTFCSGVPRSESTTQGLTAMVYQKEAGLVEFSVSGAKSSGARSVPHRCRATA